MLGVAPELASGSVAQVGVRGQSLRIVVEGVDVDEDVSGVIVELLAASGDPIPLFDRDGDGTDDDPKKRVVIDANYGDEGTFTAEVTVLGMLDGIDATAARVRLVDSEGSTSDTTDMALLHQTEVPLGESCDATYVMTRCAYGLGCTGSPAACNEGTAPVIERLAFVMTDNDETELLMDGTEAEDDLKAIFLEFLDRNQEPVMLDLDADGTPESTSFNMDVLGKAIDGRFLLRLSQTSSFAESVDRIRATPVDDNGHTGEPVEARLSRRPVRGFNQTCDPFGFDVCTSGAACAPATNGQGYRCATVGPMQSAMCASAPVVEPGESVVVTATGDAFGASLWDPPSECAANNPRNRPEGAVVLHLSEPAAGLRIRTDYDGTDFDTIVYVVEGCPRDIREPLGCDDDSGLGVFSDLDLNFVPAGDYLIVVDSYDDSGGNFVLTVEIE